MREIFFEKYLKWLIEWKIIHILSATSLNSKCSLQKKYIPTRYTINYSLQLTSFRSSQWYQLISESLMLFANYYALFQLVRDYMVFWKLYDSFDKCKENENKSDWTIFKKWSYFYCFVQVQNKTHLMTNGLVIDLKSNWYYN